MIADPFGIYEDDPLPVATWQIVSATDLAAYLGLSLGRVAALGREGTIPRRDDGAYDLKPAVAAYCGFLRVQARGRPSQTTSAATAAAKARLTVAQADAAEMKAAQIRGDLVPAADVARAWRTIAADLRAAVLAMPPRVAGACGLDRHVMAAIDRELRIALGELSDAA